MKQHIACMWSVLYTHIVPNKQVDTQQCYNNGNCSHLSK